MSIPRLKTEQEETPSFTPMGIYNEAAVVTASEPSASIARDILKRGGNAVDAMIAATLCDGVVCPQSTGLGGGFVMLYYKKADNKVYSVDARETAPGAASENMHHGDSAIAMKGGLSIATPGELKGLWDIYKRFGGGIEWKDLFEDTINLCREGISVTKHLATRVTDRVGACDYEKIPLLKEMLTNSKAGQFLKEGDFMFRPKLAETLEVLQREGGDALYTGSLSKNFVEDLQQAGSIGRISIKQNYVQARNMGCALESCIRNNVKEGVIPFEELEKRDVTFYQTDLCAN